MTPDPDLSALAVLRVLATHEINSGGGIGVHYAWTPDPSQVHADAPRMAARAAFTEADRWAGRFRPGTAAAYTPPAEKGGGWIGGPGGATNQTGIDTARHLATGLRQDLAKRILTEAKEHGCAIADPDAPEHMVRLAEALGAHAARLWEAAGMAAAPPADNEAAQACDPATGLLVADAALIRHLEGLGDRGKQQAEKIRETAADPRQADFTDGPVPAAVRLWGLWLPFDPATVDAARQSPAMREQRLPDGAEPLPMADVAAADLAWIREHKTVDHQPALLRTADAPDLTTPAAWRALCRSLWWDVVRAGFRFIGTLDQGPFRGVVAGLRPGNRPGSRDGRQLELLSTDDRMVGLLDLRALKAIRAGSGGEMVKALSSPAGHQLVARGSKIIARQLAQGLPNPYRTVLPGRSELRALLGNIQSKELDALLEGAQAFRSEGPGWTIRGLFTYAEYRSSGGGKGSTGRPAEIVLSWNAELFTGRGLMVPLPDPDRGLPDIGARNRGKVEHAIWCLYSLAQEHSRDLFLHGDAPITDAEWRQIQKETGLTKRSLDRLRGKADDDERTSLFVHRPGLDGWIIEPRPGRFRLADDSAHRFLVEQGERREHRAIGGRVASQTRAGKRPRRRKRET
jgi:hypothetical protein